MCAQAAEAPEQQARGQGESFDYDAFISYAHEDRPVAAGIQKGLHRIGRRMGQLHALRVFRDATDLTASPDLWGKVTEAMDRARYLIVVLSSHAVASTWVNREVAHWLQRRGPDQLLFVVADGRLTWDESTGRFDPDRSDVALPVLTESGVLGCGPRGGADFETLRAQRRTRDHLQRREEPRLAMTEHPEGLMAAAADNIRTFNHQTRRAVLPDECIPAPDAYRILGPAAELAYAMPQALAQLGDALRRAHRVRR